MRGVRIAGIDAPELRTRCDEERIAAEDARDFLQNLIDGRTIHLTDIRFGKYAGRIVAAVRLPSGEDVSAAMLASNHALPAARGHIKHCP